MSVFVLLSGADALVRSAVQSMVQNPSDVTSFSMGDLLCTLASKEKEDGKAGAVVQALMSHMRCVTDDTVCLLP